MSYSLEKGLFSHELSTKIIIKISNNKNKKYVNQEENLFTWREHFSILRVIGFWDWLLT